MFESFLCCGYVGIVCLLYIVIGPRWLDVTVFNPIFNLVYHRFRFGDLILELLDAWTGSRWPVRDQCLVVPFGVVSSDRGSSNEFCATE